jgi:hypothetical protein
MESPVPESDGADHADSCRCKRDGPILSRDNEGFRESPARLRGFPDAQPGRPVIPETANPGGHVALNAARARGPECCEEREPEGYEDVNG